MMRNLLVSLAVALTAAAVLSLGSLDLSKDGYQMLPEGAPSAETPPTSPQGSLPPQTSPALPSPSGAPSPVNRIAFIGSDGHVYTIASDGSGLSQVTPRYQPGGNGAAPGAASSLPLGRFSWPTWSPDGRWLAFSGISGGPLQGTAYLLVADLGAGKLEQLYKTQGQGYGLVGADAPFYIQWAADSQQLAFLAASPTGLELLVARPPDGQETRVMAEGTPLYFAWAPQWPRILLHGVGGHYLLDLETPDATNVLPGESLSYRAPAWSPDGERIGYMTREQGQEALFLTTAEGDRSRLFLGRGEFHVFLWSPQGHLIAVANGFQEADAPLYRELRLLRTQDATLARALFLETVLGFFWSPDGSKLAVASLNDSRSAVRWTVVDVASGATSTVAELVPSEDQLFLLTFFDQYALSHRLWSPDSRYLVVTGALADGPSPTSQLLILDASGQQAPRAIAVGSMAFWSPT